MTKKCHGFIGVLARAAPSLFRDLLRLGYVSLIRSHLEYASAIFASSTPTQLSRLDIIQKIASRVICGTSRDAHSAPLLQALQLHSLESRRHKHIIQLIKSILSGQSHPAFKDFFTLT